MKNSKNNSLDLREFIDNCGEILNLKLLSEKKKSENCYHISESTKAWPQTDRKKS